MRRKCAFLVVMSLVVVMFCSVWAFANNPIRVFVNGNEIKSDVPAQSIQGRTMVPLRAIGEALGADVKWDAGSNSVIITSANQPATSQQTTSQQTTSQQTASQQTIATGSGLTRNSPTAVGNKITTPDGYSVSVLDFVDGDKAWNIIKGANQYNDFAPTGYKYVLVLVDIKNIASAEEPAYISESDFNLVGSSNKVFNPFDKSAVLPDEGTYKELSGQIYHGGTIKGVVHFCIPKNETNLVLVWDKSWISEDKRYFKVE